MEGEPKRNSKKIDLDEFEPVICSTKDEIWFHFIVCLKRMTYREKLLSDNPLSNPPSEQIADKFDSCSYRDMVHPVAIVLANPAEVLYGFPCAQPGLEREWIVQPTKSCGIGETVAKAALVEAYRGVDQSHLNWPKKNRLYLKFARPTLCIEDKATMRTNQLKSLRNVTIWTLWDSWEDEKIPMNSRVEILRSFGFSCTLDGLRRVKEEVLG